MNPCCVSCTFWLWNLNGPDYRRDVHIDAAPYYMLNFMKGDCRRRAPTRSQTMPSGAAREYPVTVGADWCGEWKLLSSEAVEESVR